MDQLLTVDEVAAWARLSPASVSRAAKLHELDGRKIGRAYRFTVTAVRAWSGFSDVTVEDIRAASERVA